MTIRYDYQIFCKQQYGGISRYFYELIKGMESKVEINIQLDLLFSDNRYFQLLKDHSTYWKNLDFKGKKDFTNFIANCYDSCQVGKKDFDVFHPTYYNKSSLGRSQGKPMIITIHDLIDEKFHKYEHAFQSLIDTRKAHITKANKIIAVSENTKKDLIELYHIMPEKIEVIHHGNSFKVPITRFSLAPILQDTYLFFLGRRDGYKNFIPFVKALKNILEENRFLQVVCGGGGNFTKDELALFEKLNISKQLKYIPIETDTELASLYNNAILFIYPSLYEGFGFPIIEAFQCGCPVITSNCSSTIEIGGIAATYFDPNDEASISKSIYSILYNEDEQKKMIRLGYTRALNFTWQKTVDRTVQLYQSL